MCPNFLQRRAKLATVAFIAALATILPNRAGAQRVTFRFAPPDGVVLEEVYQMKKELLGLAKPEAETDESTTRYTIRRTQTGYTVLAEPVRRPAALAASPDARAAIFSKLEVTYDLDTLGALVRVRGAEDAFRQLGELDLGPILAAFGQQRKTPAEMVADAWNQTRVFGFLAGYSLRTDSAYVEDVRAPWMGGPRATVKMQITTVVPATPKCGEPRCVQVFTTRRSSDPLIGRQMAQTMRAAVVGTFEMLAKELRKAGEPVPFDGNIEAQIPKIELRNSTLVEEELRTLDPTTGLPYSMITKRTVEATLVTEGEQPGPFKARYTHTFSYRRIR